LYLLLLFVFFLLSHQVMGLRGHLFSGGMSFLLFIWSFGLKLPRFDNDGDGRPPSMDHLLPMLGRWRLFSGETVAAFSRLLIVLLFHDRDVLSLLLLRTKCLLIPSFRPSGTVFSLFPR